MAALSRDSSTPSVRSLDGSERDRNAVTWTLVVETMGLEPTTPCLQSGISRIGHLGVGREIAGQATIRVTAMTAE
jgi:hypothetical protein